MKENKLTALVQRIFSIRGFKRAFSIARLVVAIMGAGIASVYFLLQANTIAALAASVGMAFTSYVLFRYGQIKSYLP